MRIAEPVRELGRQATGPVLHIGEGGDPSLGVLAQAIREAGRRVPLIACSRGAPGQNGDDAIVHVGGSPATELRGLALRFAAVVIDAGAPEELADELAALEGKLMARAPVLVLDADDSTLAAVDLEVHERQGTTALLGEAASPPELGLAGGRAAGSEHSALEIEALGARLSESEAAQAALAEALARARRQLRTLATAAPGAAPPLSEPGAAAAAAPVTVVIAVHDGHDALARCLESVVAHTAEPHPIHVIDDASADPRVGALLAAWRERSARITVLTNPERRGDTAALAAGCDLAPGDVVLLASDTEVAEGWLDGLRSVARSRHHVASVAPVSDRELPPRSGLEEMARRVARHSERRRPPTRDGRGRCLYLRREALDRLGGYDGDAFQRRAEAIGLANLLDDATFVSRSPAAKRRRSTAEDGLDGLRAALRATPDPARPTILLVVHAGAGGTPQTNQDLARSLSAGFRCLTLACDLRDWILYEAVGGDSIELERIELATEWEITGPLGEERAGALRAVCERERVDLVHVRSLIATGPELVGVVKELGLPLVCSLHDFWTVCPTIQLLDERERFCHGHCTPGAGPCPTSQRWASGLPPLKHAYVHEWKARMGEQLAAADAFVTTSEAAKRVLVDHFGFMDDGRMRIIEHGRDAGGFRPVAVPPGERPRVAVFGALGIAKGVSLLRALLELDQREGAAFEFHFLGALHGSFTPGELGGVVHGPYERDELPARLAELRPSFALVSSIWTETYCHTLTEAWMAGLPVFASDIGTLRERIGRHGGGWLLDHADPGAFYAGMRRIGSDVVEWHLRRAEIAAMPARTVDDMARDYRALYRELVRS